MGDKQLWPVDFGSGDQIITGKSSSWSVDSFLYFLNWKANEEDTIKVIVCVVLRMEMS